ncbi:MAG: PEBP family protein, partial [Verrucomicrobiaceae bacterium]
FHGKTVYLASPNEVFRAEVRDDGSFGPLEMIIHDLPDAGQHNTRTVQIGPNQKLYIGVGSTCNECGETNPENATILQASLDGKTRSIFAAGLRDPVGWGWHPVTGELWEVDHGIDWLGDEIPPEEVNKLEKGKFYGWPYVYADNQLNPRLDPVGGLLKSDWLESSTPMVLGYKAHAAPMQMSFYNGAQFPKEYAGDAFVSMRGSWNRKKPVGYEVVRIKFRDGQAVSIEPFVTGFVTAEGEKGRLCGNAVSQNGSLLFSDDRNGVIYRVSYTGSKERAKPVPVPSEAMEKQNATSFGVPLAMERVESSAKDQLKVTSPSFENGEPIPAVYLEYFQGNSFPLEWSGVPDSAKSLVLIMEDRDAKAPATPVVHWVAWNIPPAIGGLRP